MNHFAIVGTRSFCDLKLVATITETLCRDYPDITVVSGGAVGPDDVSEKVAKRMNRKTLIFKPNWAQYGKRAGFLRNEQIIAASDFVVAFWDGKSKGTEHSINLAIKMGKPINIYIRAK